MISKNVAKKKKWFKNENIQFEKCNWKIIGMQTHTVWSFNFLKNKKKKLLKICLFERNMNKKKDSPSFCKKNVKIIDINQKNDWNFDGNQSNQFENYRKTNCSNEMNISNDFSRFFQTIKKTRNKKQSNNDKYQSILNWNPICFFSFLFSLTG